MNAKTIEIIKEIADLLYSIVESESTENPSESSAPAAEPKSRSRKPSTSLPSKKKDEKSEDTGTSAEYTREDLDNMSYNEIKKLAKSLGISAAGDRDSLVSKILGEEEDSSEEVKAPAKKGVGRKMTSKKSEPEEEEEPSEEEDDSESSDLYKEVSDAVADTETEDIVSALKEAGVTVRKGSKRQTVINLLVKAVEDGLIDLDGSDEEEEETEESSSVREEAIEKSNADIDKQFEDGEITREELIDWYCEAYDKKPLQVKKMKDSDLLNAYKEASALYIGDDGETHEEGEPYEVDGEPYCCGCPLKYNKDDDSYICEQCGNEYSGSDEE